MIMITDYIDRLSSKELEELREELEEDYYLVRGGGSYDNDCYMSEKQWQLFCRVESNRDEDRKKLLNPFTRQPVKPEKFNAKGARIPVHAYTPVSSRVMI